MCLLFTMRALDVFNQEFSGLMNQIPKVPETPELEVANLPCGLLSF